MSAPTQWKGSAVFHPNGKIELDRFHIPLNAGWYNKYEQAKPITSEEWRVRYRPECRMGNVVVMTESDHTMLKAKSVLLDRMAAALEQTVKDFDSLKPYQQGMVPVLHINGLRMALAEHALLRDGKMTEGKS